MGKYTQVALTLTRGIGLAPQGRAPQTLVLREAALHLPALPVHPSATAALRPFAKAPHHLPPVAALRPLPPLVAAVQGDHRRADAQVLPAVTLALLAVERRIGQHPVVADPQRRLGHEGAELRRVVGGARLTVAAVRKWLLVSQATANLVQSRELCLRLA